MSRVLITGSNGFIGSHLAEALFAGGHTLKCMVRKTSDLKWISDTPKECAYADFTDPGTLDRAIEGVEEVYHLGGVVRALYPRRLYDVNTAGTVNLVRALKRRAEPVKRFVYVSSQAAWGPGGRGPVSDYGRSKREAEESVKDIPGWAIVRPAVVYGPRESDFFSVFKMASKGFFFKPAGAGLLSFIHVKDCVRGIIEARPGRESYLSDGKSYAWDDVCAALGSALERKIRCIRIPDLLLRVLGAAGVICGRAAGMEAPLNPDKVREMLAGDWVMPPPETPAEFDIAEGFRDTYLWYLENGWL